MGTDIYGSLWAKEGERWRYLCDYDYHERGVLKYWLAPWSPERVEPIAPWRGPPPNYPGKFQSELCSWVLADEIIEALPLRYKSTMTLSEAQISNLEIERYLSIHRKPQQLESDGTLFSVECVMDRSDEVQDFVDMIRSLALKHGTVRFVFEYV